MSARRKVAGIACGTDGCRALTQEVADEILRQARAQKAERAQRMPDEASAVRAMHDAWQRLKELGWSEATYAPKDCSRLRMIEVESSGVHEGYRDEIGFWIQDTDTWPSRPVLYRLAARATPAGGTDK